MSVNSRKFKTQTTDNLTYLFAIYLTRNRTVWPRGPRHKVSSPLEYSGRGFESHSMHECLFIVYLYIGSGPASG